MAIYKLGDIGEFKGGISTLDKSKYDNGIIFVNYMDIFKNISIKNTDGLRRYDADEGDYVKHNLIWGDALFTASSETPDEIAMSSVYLSNEKAIFNGFSKRFRFDHEILNPKYASYLFRSETFRKTVSSYATGYTRYNISQNDLMKIPLEIPNTIIQQKIIDIIEPIENLFIKYPNVINISNYEDAKKDVKKLIDIIEPIENMENVTKKIIDSISLNVKSIANTNKYKKIGEITSEIRNNKMGIKQLSAKVLKKRDATISNFEDAGTYKTNTFFTEKGTLLINTIRTYLNKFAIVPENCDSNGTLIHLKVDKFYETTILKSLLSDAFWDETVLLSQGTKMPVIKKSDLLNIEIPVSKFNIENLFDFIILLNNFLLKLENLKNKAINILIEK